MRKLYLVPFVFAAFTANALGQTAAEGAGAPGTSGNPGMNNRQSDERNQPNAPSRPRNTVTNGATSRTPEGAMNSAGGRATTGTSSNAMNPPANSMPNTTQSVAPGSAPQGSNMTQMAKPKPRNADESGTNKP